MIVFDDMITQKIPPTVSELFIRGRKLNISLVFITQSYFRTPKEIRLNCTHYFLMSIPNKQELQKISYAHAPELDFRGFKELYIKNTPNPHDFFVIDTTLPSRDSRWYRSGLVCNGSSDNEQTEIPVRENGTMKDLTVNGISNGNSKV